MTYPNSFVKVGYSIIASNVPIEADNSTRRIICSKSIEGSSFASSTIPPSKKACSKFDVLEMSNTIPTTDNATAIFFKRTPLIEYYKSLFQLRGLQLKAIIKLT